MLTPTGAASGETWPPLRAHRRAGAVLLGAALAGFVVAAFAELAAAGTPSARALFWTGVALLAGCLVGLPLLLLRVLHLRGIERLERRLWIMRAVWGGPFGAMGALWDLTGERRIRPL